MSLIETHEEYLAALQHHQSLLDLSEYLDPEDPQDAHHFAALGLSAQYIRDYETQIFGDTPPAFAVDTVERLEWYVGKQADLTSRINRIKAQAASMIADLERQADALDYRFGHQAKQVLESQLSGRRRSVKFLTGTVGLRKVAGRVSWSGELQDLPEEIAEFAVVTKVDAAALNRMVKVVDGQAYDAVHGQLLELPGLQITPEGEKFYVKAGKEDADE